MARSKETVPSPARRRVLGTVGAVGAAAMAGFPAIVSGQGRSLKVGAYGGYFKDSFDEHIFPVFTGETGIEVESVAEPTGEAWLTQLNAAAQAGHAPADVSMIAQVSMLKGQKSRLWTPLDEGALGNLGNVTPGFVHRYPDGALDGVGAVAWYITLVSNTEVFPDAPASWGDMWADDKRERLGLLALVTNSFLMEVTAKTFFGGTGALDDEAGQIRALEKLAELKPNVALWYRDEAQFEQALKSGEVPMGQYYHDVATLTAADGFPVRSTFPKEGGISDSGLWAVSRASKKLEEAHVFIDFMCRPDIQALLSRKVGTAPTVRRDLLDLSPEEFASVSSDIDPVIPRYDLYEAKADWLAQKWAEMIAS